MATPKPFDITDGKNRYRPCPNCGATVNMGLVHIKGRLCVLCVTCDFAGPGIPDPKPCWQNDKKAFDYWNALPRPQKAHDFRLDHRQEFDEIFLPQASVHIERMDERAFWIGIDAPGLPGLMVNTGVDRAGTWYFNIEEDDMNGRRFKVHRPRSRTPRVRKTEK